LAFSSTGDDETEKTAELAHLLNRGGSEDPPNEIAIILNWPQRMKP
jgi:hypothetical protein